MANFRKRVTQSARDLVTGVPLVVYPERHVSSRGRVPLALIQIPCVALGVLVTVALLPHPAGWLSLVLAVIAVAILVGMMMNPGTLTIDETGFTTRHPFATMHWSWNRTSNYRVIGRGVIPQVYFDAEPAEVDTRTKKLFMSLGGSLPRYGVNVNDLAATLTAYQEAASRPN